MRNGLLHTAWGKGILLRQEVLYAPCRCRGFSPPGRPFRVRESENSFSALCARIGEGGKYVGHNSKYVPCISKYVGHIFLPLKTRAGMRRKARTKADAAHAALQTHGECGRKVRPAQHGHAACWADMPLIAVARPAKARLRCRDNYNISTFAGHTLI